MSAVARLPGFVIPLAIAAFFGAGPTTDAYFVAYSAALMIGGTLGQAIEAAIVPFVARETAGTSGSPRRFLATVSQRAGLVGGALWCAVTVPLAITHASTNKSIISLLYPHGHVYRPALFRWLLVRTGKNSGHAQH